MERKFAAPEDLMAKLGDKKQLYDIINIDCESTFVLFKIWYSELICSSLQKVNNKIYKGIVSKEENGNPVKSFWL